MKKLGLVLGFACLVISANCFAQTATIIEFQAGQDGKPYKGKDAKNTIPNGKAIFNDTLNNFYNALAEYCKGLGSDATQQAEGKSCFTKMPVKDRGVSINGKTSEALCKVSPDDCVCIPIPKLPTPPSGGGGGGSPGAPSGSAVNQDLSSLEGLF